MQILLLQGANMVHLGQHEREIYGRATAADLDALLKAEADTRKIDIEIAYTNIEGEAIDRIYAANAAGFDGLLLNPAGFQYAGYALRDCLHGVRETRPCIEVHITKKSITDGLHTVTAAAARGMICGLGFDSYIAGLDALVRLLKREGRGR
jgi:3-dehydroquinate dehydratase-2